jgi:uncharacterized membrane protein
VIGKFAIILAAVAIIGLIVSMSPSSPQAYGEEWWNGSWHYRVKITVNTSYYDRFEWPVEYAVNFTALFDDLNLSGPLDENSTRVVEVNDSGGFLQEVPSQFDQAIDYDASSNAAGTISFILNDTTPSHTERWFYVYFDLQKSQKTSPAYSSIISKTWDGDEFNITFNNEATEFYGFFVFDTNRSQNTSGLYQFRLDDYYRFTYSYPENTTRELIQTTDGEYNYSYDLRANASFLEGPARISAYQEGYEIYWNDPDNRTNMTYLMKSYRFYPNKTWFIIDHEIININDTVTVDRGSYAGISGFDVDGAYDTGSGYKIEYNYSMDPGSFISAREELGTDKGGYAHIWENGTTNFRADNYTFDSSPSYDRIGINLSMTSILPGESIQDRSVMVFFHSVNNPDLLEEVRDRLMYNINITEGEPEMWDITLDPLTDHTIYNRNESAVLWANITRDDWSITNHVNATLDMGTPAGGDDVTIQLLDDGVYPDTAQGDGNFTAYYNFSDSEAIGYWNMTARAYDADGSFLNESYHTFNITADLFVNITFWNITGLVRVDNATIHVMNYREDTFIPNVTMNCTNNGVPVPQQNITDFDNGTYIVTFQTPFDYGAYPLNCSAGKDGSWGFDLRNYTVESPETNLSISPDPTIFDSYNVTFYGNESFDLKVTLQNIGNSSAYDLSFNLSLPGNLSSNFTAATGDCGLVIIGDSCVRTINVTVLNNSYAMNYTINITGNWTNRVGSSGFNTSSVTVTVHENPILDVLQENVTGILPPGASSQAIETLIVRSLGNNDTLNISFEAIGLGNFSIQFSPPDLTQMGPGEEQPVQVIASVPASQFPGLYDGLINVTSDNGGYRVLNTTMIVTGTNLTINATPETYTALYVTALNNESMEFAVNVTNTGNTTAFNSYVNVTLPASWYINQTNQSCGNLTRGSTCMTYYYVNITELTNAGNYTINATIFWEDPGISWQNRNDSIDIDVVSNVTLEVAEDIFEAVIEHGTSVVIGNLSVLSSGNDDVTSTDFNLSQEFDNFTIEFNQTYPFGMVPGNSRTIRINATLPLGFDPGYYNGTLNVSSGNNGYKLVSLNITVPENGSWTTNTTFCEHSQSPATGVVCDVLINNTGNIMLNFSITPSGANHSSISPTDFNLSKQNSSVVTVSYDMGGDAGTGFFSTNYTIDPLESPATPDNLTLEILLNPFVEPFIEIGVTPNMTEQANSATIVVNITSKSGAAFDTTSLTVRRPDGNNDTMSLGFTEQVFWLGCDLFITDPDDKLCYMVTYPADLNGNTSERGNYTVEVFANDTYAVNSTNTSIFKIYARYIAYLNMPDTSQGSWESVNYRSRDYLDASLPGAQVNITIKDPDNRTVYMLSGLEYTTDESGWVSNNIFVIPAHATLGEYTIYTNGSWFDPDVNLSLNNETAFTFNVTDDPTLTGKVAIPSPVVVDRAMPVSVVVLENFNQPVDPDEIDLKIYYTEGYSLQLWQEYDMTDFTRNTTGFYSLTEILSSVLTGTYLAMLRVTLGDRETYDIQAFRIASSGPYDVEVSLDQAVWNKGEVDNEDVVIDYWVQGSDGSTWDSGQMTPNIGAGMQVVFRPTNGLFIYSNQPPGSYTVEVRVLYDPSIPSAPASEGFQVTGEAPPGEEEPGGGGGGEGAPAGPGGGPGPSGEINITKIPDQIGVMAGTPRIFNVHVEAVGGPVSNVWLELQGIPSNWYVIDPANISSLSSGETAIITVQVNPPRGESGEVLVNAVAHSTESTDEKEMLVRIFASKKDLINFELVRLRAKLDELRERAEKAKEAGFDTGEVEDLLDDAEKEIGLAEGYLREELYDASLDSIYTAWRLLEEAEDLLDNMLAGITIPWWMLLIIVFGFVIAGLIFLYRKISENLKLLVRGRLSEARQVAGTIKGAGLETEKLREEKAKTARMLALLESQFKQGIISKEAFESLKTRSEQRMGELDKKIRESIKA